MNATNLSTLLGRDPFSMGTHLLGALLSLIATYLLVRRARQNGMRGLGVGAYGATMAVAFSASALFHYVEAGSPRYELYNKLDHSAIFLMIAGTGTAIYAALQVYWANYLTGSLWATALLGILFKLTLWPMPDWLTATVYLAVGWIGAGGVLVFGRVAEERPLSLFLFGALVFSAGAVVYVTEWPSLWTNVVGAHGLFHVLVLLGAALHFEFVYRHCTKQVVPHNADGSLRERPRSASA